MTRIYIHNLSRIKDSDLASLTDVIAKIFLVPVYVHHLALNFEEAYDGVRGQYSSSILLSQLLSNGLLPETKHIVIVDVDLFIPILTFIYGEAQFEGQAAIVSMHRLNNEFYGLGPNSVVLYERLQKEIVHELGHTFGLYHCRQFECVMRSSTYVEEIDLKRVTLCPDCDKSLREKSPLQLAT